MSNISNCIGATLMVAATTADDAIWLVPYTSPSLPLRTRLIHGALFVVSLECLAVGCVAVASGIQWAVSTSEDGDLGKLSPSGKWTEKTILGAVGAAICWLVALFLCCCKWWKKRRRNLAKAKFQRETTQQASNTYGAITGSHDDDASEGESWTSVQGGNEEDRLSSEPSPCAVISFTTLGALDEVSYFPSLLLGQIVTPLDLCLGTFFAACIILAVVTLFLSQCRHLLHWLERIPLYWIVSAFAIALTAGVVRDVLL
ncbi:hypothetical protein ACHAWF_006813 [Thalassiosira exigua]